MATAISLLRKSLHTLGALRVWRRTRARALTVVMFHRVLAAGDVRFSTCDLEYALRADLFERCLEFFANEYTVVGPEALGSRLPDHALLVTFDDGWADHEQTALPVMRMHNVPAVCFVAADAIDGDTLRFWETEIIHAVRAGRFTDEDALALWQAAGQATRPVLTVAVARELIAALVDSPPATAAAAVHARRDRWRTADRHMLTRAELANLARNQVEVGAHGATHVPLARCADGASDLTAARTRLQQLGVGPIRLMSFPHGSYDATLVEAARSAGFAHVFTSDPVLTPTDRPLPFVIGRIGFDPQQIVDDKGRFSADRLALLLARRPVVALRGDRSERARRYK